LVISDSRDVKKILIMTSDKNLREVLKFCFDGWGYEPLIYDHVIDDITVIKKISPDVVVVDVHSANRADLEICHLLKSDFITAFIPVITLINKRQLRSQLLNIKHGVDDYLIKPPDPLDLRVRLEMAIKRAQHSFFATSLTGLPGGRFIEETLKERLETGAPFSFGYLDLDNFKYFNDVYGYLKGDRAIMHTAYLLYSVINRFGNSNDFIGHIGGDDFVFITTPDKHKVVAANFICAFNKIMPFHYSDGDRQRGYIIARDRTKKVRRIPLLSASIAIVNKEDGSAVKNVIEINERLAEIKRYLKTFRGSKFMADRRNDKTELNKTPQIYMREDCSAARYKPLGQVLVEGKFITREKLEEALAVHWRRGVRLGEILQELGLIKQKDLTAALRESAKLQGAGVYE